jgi:hypothetical protein
VYVVSPDSDSAYEPADRMVMARVKKDGLREREKYTFFTGFDEEEKPLWAGDIADRGAVFEDPGRCYRSGVSFNAGLGRFLWVHTLGRDSRFEGGFTVRSARQPWGPWDVAFTIDNWDVGPGESASFPPKWISNDGRSAWLLFSGDDCFSLRRAEFQLH